MLKDAILSNLHKQNIGLTLKYEYICTVFVLNK